MRYRGRDDQARAPIDARCGRCAPRPDDTRRPGHRGRQARHDHRFSLRTARRHDRRGRPRDLGERRRGGARRGRGRLVDVVAGAGRAGPHPVQPCGDVPLHLLDPSDDDRDGRRAGDRRHHAEHRHGAARRPSGRRVARDPPGTARRHPDRGSPASPEVRVAEPEPGVYHRVAPWPTSSRSRSARPPIGCRTPRPAPDAGAGTARGLRLRAAPVRAVVGRGPRARVDRTRGARRRR